MEYFTIKNKNESGNTFIMHLLLNFKELNIFKVQRPISDEISLGPTIRRKKNKKNRLTTSGGIK